MSKTIADHIARAEEDLDRSRQHREGAPAYAALVQSAIANALTAVALLLLGQEKPPIPGLPKGYELDTDQDPDGERKWAYTLTCPGGRAVTSRHLWGAYEGALGAGIRAAQLDAELPAEQAANGSGPEPRQPAEVPADRKISSRYEVRSADPGFGVWDRERHAWVEPEFGAAAGMSELDAALLLASLGD